MVHHLAHHVPPVLLDLQRTGARRGWVGVQMRVWCAHPVEHCHWLLYLPNRGKKPQPRTTNCSATSGGGQANMVALEAPQKRCWDLGAV